MSLDDEIIKKSKEATKQSRLPLTRQGEYIYEDGFIQGANFIKKKHAWIDINEQLPPPCKIVDTKYKNTYAYLFHLENGEFDNCSYSPQLWREIINY